MAWIQGQGEDQQDEEIETIEGAKEEEAKEEPIATNKKKRKEKTQVVIKPKKIVKPSQHKPTTPTTRASMRVTTQKAKEVSKTKEKEGEPKKRPRRKYVS